MRRTIVLSFALALVGTGSFAAESEAQATVHELRTLAQYPKPVREAILEVLNHPAVLKKVEAGGTGLKKALKGENASVQEAARVLVEEGEVLKLLKEHPDVFSLVAKAYALDKKKIIGQLDQEEQGNEKAADDWANRLEADQPALGQFREAAEAYAKMPGGSAHDSGATVAAAAMTIHGQPTPGFIRYVMSNADRYPALGSAMTGQWLGSRNTAAYDRAFHHWWGQYENHFHPSLLAHNAHRAHRLGELARFDRQHGHIAVNQRYAGFHTHAKQYPHLGKLAVHDPKKHTPRAGMHQKPEHKEPHPHAKGPGKAGGKGHHAVHRKAGSHHHRMHHAKAGHHHHAQHHAAHHGGKKK